MAKKVARVGFRLEDKLMDQLQDLADEQSISVSELARGILARALRARCSKSKKAAM